jgi:hypothetical protein
MMVVVVVVVLVVLEKNEGEKIDKDKKEYNRIHTYRLYAHVK